VEVVVDENLESHRHLDPSMLSNDSTVAAAGAASLAIRYQLGFWNCSIASCWRRFRCLDRLLAALRDW
jgi:hypothetical protein